MCEEMCSNAAAISIAATSLRTCSVGTTRICATFMSEPPMYLFGIRIECGCADLAGRIPSQQTQCSCNLKRPTTVESPRRMVQAISAFEVLLRRK